MWVFAVIFGNREYRWINSLIYRCYLKQDYLTEVREYKVLRAKASQGVTAEQPMQQAAAASA